MADHLFRENAGKMTAVLCRAFGIARIDRVLDIVQDTFEAALVQWRFSGVPEQPAAWLMQTAKYKAINAFKRDSRMLTGAGIRSGEAADQLGPLFPDDAIADSQLRLLLMCCQPGFTEKKQVALTLHILCGFGIPEIANALLTNPEAVKKMLTRAKTELKKRPAVFEMPGLLQLDQRVELVQTVLYLLFNEGYKTTRGREAIDHDLCYEAIRLVKLLLTDGVSLQSSTRALLALMFFNISRFPSRLSAQGCLLTLEEQDRSSWDRVFIEEGYAYLREAAAGQTISRYHIEAVISSVHCAAPTFAETDWPTLVYLYGQLEALAPSPMVLLNRMIAESYVNGPEHSLALLDERRNDPTLAGSYLFHATEGHLLDRAGRFAGASAAYAKAAELASSPADRQFLVSKATR